MNTVLEPAGLVVVLSTEGPFTVFGGLSGVAHTTIENDILRFKSFLLYTISVFIMLNAHSLLCVDFLQNTT